MSKYFGSIMSLARPRQGDGLLIAFLRGERSR